MKILVTGGAGYVGSHCVRRLADAGHDVVVYDNLSAGHAAAVPDSVPLIEADLADSVTLGDTLADGFDAVMHFAARIDAGESVKQPLDYYQCNITNTVNLLRIMQRHGVDRLVFSSTAAVYGTPPSTPITEDMPLVPINPYGRTKLAMEWAVGDSVTAWNLAACALRYFNASGAADDGSIGEDHRPEFHLIPLVLQVALGQRDQVSMFGTDYATPDGTCIRDYIHVDDLADAHLLAVEALKPGRFQVYNVGTGAGHSVRELIDVAREVTGHPLPVVEAPRRAGDPPRLFADSTKIQQVLGWKPNHAELATVVESAWQWHRTHPRGFGDRTA